MDIYTAYNLCIHSEIPLLETMTAVGPADVTVRLGKLDEVSRTSLDWGQRFLGTMPESGKFLIQNGNEIIIDPAPQAPGSMLRSTVLGPAMAVILRQRGFLVLHASAVVIQDRAIAFMGGSGWGKSTLANAFHRKGYELLTDDVLAINVAADGPLVHPAFPQMRLWSEAAEALGHQASSLSPLNQNTTKLSYEFDQGFRRLPTPLRRIYVLAKGTEHSIVKLAPQVAFAELVRHTREVSSLKAAEFVTSHLRQCTQLINTIEFSRFTRKPALEALPDLVAMVEADLNVEQQVGAFNREELAAC
ncbi:MAG: hypothetical protein F6K42_38275 [Leptolyngbya sp. SIO1D8]|nr:hypothetical protein [Leptolyngbya sp. SIO1D8]